MLTIAAMKARAKKPAGRVTLVEPDFSDIPDLFPQHDDDTDPYSTLVRELIAFLPLKKEKQKRKALYRITTESLAELLTSLAEAEKVERLSREVAALRKTVAALIARQ